ncbi:hypothetical protein AD998_18110 [bacterium 336/3]|nr:hypothetical protein AD998_18110 [bacterium 336/3]
MKKQKNKKIKDEIFDSLKPKGYTHLTKKIANPNKSNIKKTLHQISNKNYILKYNFFPLLKYTKIEQKYKKVTDKELEKSLEKSVLALGANDKLKRRNSKKERIIEYPTHQDSLIYSFYSKLLLTPIYENVLKSNHCLNESVIGYRKIPLDKNKGKSTIHFAKDVFEHIQKFGECYVITFDIKDFFPSINHHKLFDSLLSLLKSYLKNPSPLNLKIKSPYKNLVSKIVNNKKNQWQTNITENRLPEDLYKIFRAVTQYACIDLQHLKKPNGKRLLTEQRLSEISKKGIEAFFTNPKEMRDYLRENKIIIHKNKEKGIPHGLPISSLFANIYMKPFDEAILSKLKDINSEFLYRRYSDDMIVVLPKIESFDLQKLQNLFKNELKKIELELSTSKTECFEVCKLENSLLSVKKKVTLKNLIQKKSNENNEECLFCKNTSEHTENYSLVTEWRTLPITYLGLEFHGEVEANNNSKKRLDVRLKNSSIQKFYRRMDIAIQRQVKRAFIKHLRDLTFKPIVFRRQLYRLFSKEGAFCKYKDAETEKNKRKKTIKKAKILDYDNSKGYFVYSNKKKKTNISAKHMGNAITFARRADFIFFGERQEVMFKQYRNANKILESRIAYWVNKYQENITDLEIKYNL